MADGLALNFLPQPAPGRAVTIQRFRPPPADDDTQTVGGGTFLNVGAWVRPRTVDFDGFAEETGVKGWSKQDFEPFFQQCEKTQFVHRTPRENWNPGSIASEKAANRLGIKMYETSTNKFHCIFCGHRLDAGMPCKYDSLMGTAQTQIPKAIAAGATVLDNATVVKVEITNNKATGVLGNGFTGFIWLNYTVPGYGNLTQQVAQLNVKYT